MNFSVQELVEVGLGMILGVLLFIALLIFLNQQTYSPKGDVTQRFFKYQGY